MKPQYLPENPLPVSMGDPYILPATNGRYYLYGTGGAENGFRCYSSRDLVEWIDEGQVFFGGYPGDWCQTDFWAPEVYEVKGRFYMFFSAQWGTTPTSEAEHYRIGVAVADRPTGPFKDLLGKPLFDPGYPVIDANLIWDAEGRVYMYYSRCCFGNSVHSPFSQWTASKGYSGDLEESWIYGVELSPDFKKILGEPVLLLRPPVTPDDPQAEWESRSVRLGGGRRRWNEGPFALWSNDRVLLFYSANNFEGSHYAVGYATASHPLGVFTKSPQNPILQSNTACGGGVSGVGHCSIIRHFKTDELLCVYHGRTATSGERRMIFIDPIVIGEGGSVKVLIPTEGQRVIGTAQC